MRIRRGTLFTPRWAAMVGATVGGVMALGGGRFLVVVAVAGAVAGLAWRRHLRARPARLRQAQLPAALDRLAASLRGGAAVPTALVAAGAAVAPPLGPELAALGHEAGGGRTTTDVLDEWGRRYDDSGTRLAATALVLATTIGAAPARAADGVAATLRERAELAAERRALGAQARTSALVLSLAPVAFALLLGATDAASARFLLGGPRGWACLAAGLGLDIAGAVWMAQLTRSVER
jgi:tight adherence protein B